MDGSGGVAEVGLSFQGSLEVNAQSTGGVNAVGELVSSPLVISAGENAPAPEINADGEVSSPLVGACSYNPLNGSLERFLKLRDGLQGVHTTSETEDGRGQSLVPGAAARRISSLVSDLENAKFERDGYRSEIESLKAMVAELQNTPRRKPGSASVWEVVSEKHEAKAGFSTPIASFEGSFLRTNGGKSPGSNSSSRSWADKVEEEEKHGAMQVPALKAGCIYGSHGDGSRRSEGHALPDESSSLSGAARQQQLQTSLHGQQQLQTSLYGQQ